MREERADVVIIGSGAGGGTVAKALAPLCREGARIVVLEWGPRLADEEFATPAAGRELTMARKLYVEAGGVLNAERTMTLAFGRGYGGSTVVYTGTSLIIPQATLARWGVPGLSWEDIARRSRIYMQENNVHFLDEDALNDNNTLFRDACEKLGYRVEQFPINVKGCKGSSLCNLGCPNAAKQGTNRVQLPAAEREGVEVITNCKALRIGEREVIARVANAPFGLPSPWPEGDVRVTARAVVVAAGAVNSPALLLRSRLPVSLPALGRYFTAHPALILVGEHERPITNFYGHPKSFYCDHFAETHGFLLETCMYFPFTTAKNLIGFGAEHSELMRRMDRMQMILVLAIDPALAGNRVTVGPDGEPIVHYRFTDGVLDSLLESMKVSARIFFAAGARRVHAPAGERFFIEASEVDRLDERITRRRLVPGRISISSAHLMGGCRMGSDRETSVTDSWGQVHGVPWLFVADASLFPRAAEINPYITIMALADRVAERVRAYLEGARPS